MDKIRIGFECTDTWNRDDFRNFIKQLLKEDDKYEVFLISNDDTTAYIMHIGQSIGIPEGNIIIVNFTVDKIEAIQNYAIDIYFDNLQYVVEQVETTTSTYAILVDSIPDKYNVKTRYYSKFERVLEEIQRQDEEVIPQEED